MARSLKEDRSSMMYLGLETTGLMVFMNMGRNMDQFWLKISEDKLSTAILCNLSFCCILWEEGLDLALEATFSVYWRMNSQEYSGLQHQFSLLRRMMT